MWRPGPRLEPTPGEGLSSLISRVWVGPQSCEGEAIHRAKPSAWQEGAKSRHPAEGLPDPRQPPPRSTQTRAPTRVLSFALQSPPKLNEVSSDASRENAAAESGSESSSQEATPEKGMLQACRPMGRTPRDGGMVHPSPCLGGTGSPARCSSTSLT